MSFKYLRIFFIISICVLFFTQFSPYLVPEVFPSTADKINEIITKVCYAYIGSFIFYYLVVYLKRKRDDENIEAFVSNYVQYMYYNYKFFINAIQQKDDAKVEFPDKEKLKSLLKSIDPNTDAPLVMGVGHKTADWFEFLDYVYDRHHKYLRRLETLMPHLPTALIRILNKADFATHRTMNFVWFRSWQNANNKRYTNLEFSSASMWGYVKSIKLLKEYHEKVHGKMEWKDLDGDL